MLSGIQVLNPLDDPGWNMFVTSTGQAGIFHTSNWARVLHESYGYRPCYFALLEGGSLRALLPCMELKSIFRGTRGVSLPFSDSCEPLLTDEKLMVELVQHAVSYGREAGWEWLEMRSGGHLSAPPSSTYCGHVLDLEGGEEKTLSRFRASTKRNIKKALREGVTVRIETSAEALSRFYRLNCLTRREHGLPPQPYSFFQRIHEHIFETDNGIIVLAQHQEKPVAGAIFFHYGKKALFKYGAFDRRYQSLRASNLVIWEAIRWYLHRGFLTMDFGRTSPDNHGLIQYKNGWGTSPRQILYTKYNITENAYVREHTFSHEASYEVFRKMPLSLLQLAGKFLYRHMG